MEDFDIDFILSKLWEKRKLFHGEADLKFEMVEVIKKRYEEDKNVVVRVEHPFLDNNVRKHIDILVTDKKEKKGIVIELKYKTENKNKETIKIDKEVYILGNHEARNNNCYYTLKDVERLQKIVGKKIENYDIEIIKGYVIFITNDINYVNKKLGRQAQEFSLNKVNEKGETNQFKGTKRFYKKDGKTKKFDDLILNEKKSYTGTWTDLEKFRDDEKKEYQLFQLIFEIK